MKQLIFAFASLLLVNIAYAQEVAQPVAESDKKHEFFAHFNLPLY